MVTVHGIGEQLEICSHPDCLNFAEYAVGAFWKAHGEDHFFPAPTCLSHVGWCVQEMLARLDDPLEPQITVARLV